MLHLKEILEWKTTLATKIAEDFNAKTVLERFADNPFLPKFYKDQTDMLFRLKCLS
jgi:deoxyadenosine/deoxycytidine kinase